MGRGTTRFELYNLKHLYVARIIQFKGTGTRTEYKKQT